MSSHTQAVQAIYEAFGRGDVETVLSFLAPDCRWEHWSDNFAQKAGVPWLQPRVGPSQVREFFALLGHAAQVREFGVRRLMSGSDAVVAEIEITLAVGAEGRLLRDEELHLWVFDATGKVSAMRHYVDTLKHTQFLPAAG
jgi:ketosteroid isomerase-like protein